MKRIILAVVTATALGAGLGACMDDVEGARRTLYDAGLEPVEVGGYAWTGCGQGDSYRTKFKARNIKGRMVNGVVCSGVGWGKNSTIRYN